MFDRADANDLRHHYGDAYSIQGSAGRWVAVRRDDGNALFADSAAELLDRIRVDYAERPVPR